MALTPSEKEFIDGLLKNAEDRESPVLFILHGLQDRYRYIKKEHAEYIADGLSRPVTEIYSAVTFYDEFRQEPVGRTMIRVCRGITCHAKGSSKILEALKSYLNLKEGEMTVDGSFSLEEASCIGQCDGAPAMMVDDRVYRDLTPEKAISIIEEIKGEVE